MDMLHNLMQGFATALSLQNLLACFFGALIGTVVGVLPGIGPVGAMSLLLPFSFGLDAGTSLILLAGIFYGAMYGGSTTSILINVPGEAASVVTCLDGYQMAKKGRAGAALAVVAIGSFFAGTMGIVLLMLFAPPLGQAALAFGPPEYFGIALIGMLLLSNLTGDSFLRAFLVFSLGMMISTIGIDALTGYNRLSFGMLELTRGVEFLPVAMGLFGLAEVFDIALQPYKVGEAIKVKFRDLYPNREELKRSIWPIVRGTFVGFPIGLIPGPAAIMSSLVSYRVERGVSRHPEEFGKGAIEGVAGPESANNAAAAGTMVPLLALGIPFAPATAVLLGGLMIHGVAPGPTFMTSHASLFWLVIASMYIGNVMLLVFNLPMVGLFASLTKVPPRILVPIVTSLMLLGAYSVNNSAFDMWMLLFFGVLGFIFKCMNFSSTPLLVGMVLGPVFEKGLRQSLILGDGELSFFLKRPISGTMMVIAGLIVVWVIVGGVKDWYKAREAHATKVASDSV
ncbi:MAG: tripartite tricarboxylate transporter permease [Deltaproteobacteria bacterium]|nr:tripartite tricarboxylate transporter permease [Deltaproteobacteria bacterium]